MNLGPCLQDPDIARAYRERAPAWVASRYLRLEETPRGPSVDLLARWVEFAEMVLRAAAWSRISQAVALDSGLLDPWLTRLRERPTIGGLVHWVNQAEADLAARNAQPIVQARRSWQGAADILGKIRNLAFHADLDSAIAKFDDLQSACETLAEAFVSICDLRFGWFQRMPLGPSGEPGWVDSVGVSERGRAHAVQANEDVLVQVPALVTPDGTLLWLAPFLHVDDVGRLWALSHVDQRSRDRADLRYSRRGEPLLRRQVHEAELFRGMVEKAVDVATLGWRLPDGRLPDGLPVRYEILREIGRGGEGQVFAIHDHVLGRPLALKTLRQAPGQEREPWRHRVLRGARALARIRHPGVVALQDCIETSDGSFHLVLELVDGPDLFEWQRGLEADGPMADRWRRCAELTADVAEALAALHAVQVLHRDVKPHNVLMDAHGRPRLVDFGLATDATAAMQTLGVGTLGWASSHALAGHAAPSTDLHSLGKVLVYLVTGEAPQDIGDLPASAWQHPGWDACSGLKDLARELVHANEDDALAVAHRLRALARHAPVQVAPSEQVRILVDRRLELPIAVAVADACWVRAEGSDALLVAAGKSLAVFRIAPEGFVPTWQLELPEEPQTVAVSPVAPIWAWASEDGIGLCRAWTAMTVQESTKAMRPSPGGRVHALAFHPTRRWLAAGVTQNRVEVWAWTEAGLAKVRAIAPCRNDVRAVVWSEDGSLLLAGDDDGWQHVFAVKESGEKLNLIAVSSQENSAGWFAASYQTAATFRPDGSACAMGGNDSQVTITSGLGSGRAPTVTRLTRPGSVRGLRWLPGTDVVATTDLSGRLSWCEPGSQRVPHELLLWGEESALMRLIVPPDGGRLYVVEGRTVFACQVALSSEHR